MQISDLIEFDAILPTEQARMLMGDAGLGKSSVVKMIAQRREMGFVDLRLSELEPADLVGMPYVEKREDGQTVTRYAPPEWFLKLFEEPCILFLDEIDRAREDMQPLAMQLTLDRRVGGRNLPKDTIVYAAGNGIKYMTAQMDQALCNRFAMIDFTPSHAEWVAWAGKPESGVHQSVVQFLTENERMLDIPEAKRGVPNISVTSRRSWSFLGKALMHPSIKDSVSDIAQSGLRIMSIAEPFVGQEAALSFNNWVRDNYRPLDIRAIFEGKLTSAKGFSLPQLVDAIAPLMEIFNETTTTDAGRIHALKFYSSFSTEAFSAVFERMSDAHAKLLSHPDIRDLVKQLLKARAELAAKVKEQTEAKAAAKAAKAAAKADDAAEDGGEATTKRKKK